MEYEKQAEEWKVEYKREMEEFDMKKYAEDYSCLLLVVDNCFSELYLFYCQMFHNLHYSSDLSNITSTVSPQCSS